MVPQSAAPSDVPGEPPDGYDLRRWIERMDRHGELRRVDGSVDIDEEMSAITYLVGREAGAPALLFHDPRRAGHPEVRHLWNMIGSSRARLRLSLGQPAEGSFVELIKHVKAGLSRTMDPVYVQRADAPVLEHTITPPGIDLDAWPFPRHWPDDGGNYAGTGDIVVTADPDTGALNVGTYRMMVHGGDRVGLHISPGKDARRHLEAAARQGRPVPVVAVWGVHPSLMMVGSQNFPGDTCEYDVVGALTGEALPLVRGPITGLPIPASAEIAIEGEILPGTLLDEGPFGEFTGYYGGPREPGPVVRVLAMHHRTDPIVTNALMADSPSNEQQEFYSTLRAARIWAELEAVGLPGIRGVYSNPSAAGGLGMTVISIEQGYPGHSEQALNLAAHVPSGAYFTKWVIAVDHDVDPTDLHQVVWAMSTRCSPARGVSVLTDTWNTGLDPAINPPEIRKLGSRALINACEEFRYRGQFSHRTRLRRATYDRVTARWQELGLPGVPPHIDVFGA